MNYLFRCFSELIKDYVFVTNITPILRFVNQFSYLCLGLFSRRAYFALSIWFFLSLNRRKIIPTTRHSSGPVTRFSTNVVWSRIYSVRIGMATMGSCNSPCNPLTIHRSAGSTSANPKTISSSRYGGQRRDEAGFVAVELCSRIVSNNKASAAALKTNGSRACTSNMVGLPRKTGKRHNCHNRNIIVLGSLPLRLTGMGICQGSRELSNRSVG